MHIVAKHQNLTLYVAAHLIYPRNSSALDSELGEELEVNKDFDSKELRMQLCHTNILAIGFNYKTKV